MHRESNQTRLGMIAKEWWDTRWKLTMAAAVFEVTVLTAGSIGFVARGTSVNKALYQVREEETLRSVPRREA